ncbi:acyltransferase [Actinophytocola sp. NPDC049390]|uniref:acyltransferase n=1 Tax=Actinophytocola sp. NPDC049390 TaxID=3363894 RepID=UPI0037B5C364
MTGHRMSQVDNLRTVMVAWVIGAHALMGYAAVGGWAYDEVNETTFSPGFELVLTVLVGPSGLFVIGAFFFVSGLFTPSSARRKGRRAFAVDRLVRLGLPWAVSALVVWPLSVWLAYRAAGRDGTPWGLIFQRSPVFDSGALWFALVLLVYSLGYALVPLRLGASNGYHLVLAAAGIAVCSFVTRLAFPARSGQPGDLHLWQWPQCLGMFLLGLAAARSGWVRALPERVYRRCGVVTGLTLVFVPVAGLTLGITEVASGVDEFLGGWHWQAALTAAVEGVLVVFGSVWLLGLAQRRFTWSGPLATACARGAFPAFVLQGPVLLLLAIALRPLAIPAEVKAPLLLVVALATSFWLGNLLTARGTRMAPVARPAES